MHNREGRGRRSGRVAAAILAVLLLPVLFVLALPTDHERCRAWQERPLLYAETSAAEILILRDRTQVHRPHPALSAFLFPGKMGGVALPGRIIVAARLGQHGDELDDLILHETVHVAQMRRDGAARFFVRYARDLLSGRVHGCTTFSSYAAVGYEREADAFTAAVEVVAWAESGPRRRAQVEEIIGTDLLPAEGLAWRVPLTRIVERLAEEGFFP